MDFMYLPWWPPLFSFDRSPDGEVADFIQFQGETMNGPKTNLKGSVGETPHKHDSGSDFMKDAETG